MKKGMVLVVVALLAGIVFLKYRESARVKTEAAKDVTPAGAGQQQPDGVPLPSGAKDVPSVPTGQSTYVPPQPAAGQSQSSPAMPAATPAASQGPGCGAGIQDVLSDAVKKQMKNYAVIKAVGGPRIADLYGKAGRYQACMSLAGGQDLCGKATSEKDVPNYELRQACTDTLYPVGLAGYMYGKADYKFCAGYMHNNLNGADKYVPEKEFCDIAKGGLPAVSDNFCGRAPAEVRGKCLESFPKAAGGCKNDGCTKMWAISSALKAGDAGAVGGDLSPFVTVMLKKKSAACQQLADAAVQDYCSLKDLADQAMQQEQAGQRQNELDKSIRKGRAGQTGQ